MLTSNVLRQDTKRAAVGAFMIFLFLLLSIFSIAAPAIEVDLSQRTSTIDSVMKSNDTVIFNKLKSKFFQSQPIVIINTDQGFIPSKVILKKSVNYKFYIANVNESEKKTSFLLEAFNQNHETYFGKLKVFDFISKTNGVFNFICPETGSKGEVIVQNFEGDDNNNAEKKSNHLTSNIELKGQ